MFLVLVKVLNLRIIDLASQAPSTENPATLSGVFLCLLYFVAMATPPTPPTPPKCRKRIQIILLPPLFQINDTGLNPTTLNIRLGTPIS